MFKETKKHKTMEDPDSNILELREHDIMYYTRVTIDCGRLTRFIRRSSCRKMVRR